MHNDYKVIQMMSADGWYALFFDDCAPHSKLRRLLSFVLIEGKDGKSRIDAVGSDLQLCLAQGTQVTADGRWESPHFFGFFHETEVTDKMKVQWSAQAAEFVERKAIPPEAR